MNCLNCIDHGIWEKDKLIIPCLNCAEINRRNEFTKFTRC